MTDRENLLRLKYINNWLKENIQEGEYERDELNEIEEGSGTALDQYILPYLRDQEYHTFIKLSNAEMKLDKEEK